MTYTNSKTTYAPVKWEDRLWRLLDEHTDTLRLSVRELGMSAEAAARNCKAALKRMHRVYDVRVESDAIVVSR